LQSRPDRIVAIVIRPRMCRDHLRVFQVYRRATDAWRSRGSFCGERSCARASPPRTLGL